MIDPNNLIITLGNLATYHSGITSYIADTVDAIPVMDNNDVDSMMARVLDDSEQN